MPIVKRRGGRMGIARALPILRADVVIEIPGTLSWSLSLIASARCSNSKFGRHRATSGGCGARDRRAESLRPSGAPYPPYNGAGFVGWISAAHPPSASLPTRCWRRPPKFGTAARGGVQQRRSLVNCKIGHHVHLAPARCIRGHGRAGDARPRDRPAMKKTRQTRSSLVTRWSSDDRFHGMP